ncbi:c-type cytochrome [soil metagenome]
MNVYRYSFLTLLLLFALLVSPSTAVFGAEPTEQELAGQKLFKSNCASCHKLDGKLIGPALSGAEQRWAEGAEHAGVSGRDWMKRWIKNWQDPVNAGNPYAVSMQAFDGSAMTQFPQLQDADIENILAYIANPVIKKEEPVIGPATPSGDTPYTVSMLWGFVILLILVALVLARVSNILSRLVLEKEGQPVPAPVPFWKNKKLRVALTLLVVIWICNATVTGAIDLGRQQGYMPEQPIKFSHELHAGVNKINCQYCHSGAAVGKQSNIPSVNVCMNCHKGIKGDDPKNGIYGKLEISKIYAVAGFNPIDGKYFEDYNNQDKAYIDSIFTIWMSDSKVKAGKEDVKAVTDLAQKPIEWVRIHNLPDHVYFNHSQHVTAGGIECQTCHGQVEAMVELSQHAPLSMGWCINCHRETEVKFTQNPYYATYGVFHERLQSGEMKNVTVEKIGGTECQKCHY